MCPRRLHRFQSYGARRTCQYFNRYDRERNCNTLEAHPRSVAGDRLDLRGARSGCGMSGRRRRSGKALLADTPRAIDSGPLSEYTRSWGTYLAWHLGRLLVPLENNVAGSQSMALSSAGAILPAYGTSCRVPLCFVRPLVIFRLNRRRRGLSLGPAPRPLLRSLKWTIHDTR